MQRHGKAVFVRGSSMSAAFRVLYGHHSQRCTATGRDGEVMTQTMTQFQAAVPGRTRADLGEVTGDVVFDASLETTHSDSRDEGGNENL
jgi:hypothetical protein